MKKLLLATLAVGATLMAGAANITEDWSTWTSFDDPGSTPVEKLSEIDNAQNPTGVTYEFKGTYINTFSGSSYLFIKGKSTSGAYVSFSLDFPVSALKLTTASGTSTNANSKINVYAGDEKIADALAVNVKSHEYTIQVPAEYQAAGTVYKVESNTTNYNQQFSKFEYVELTTDPQLEFGATSLDFQVVKNGTQTQHISIMAANLTEDITLKATNSQFTLSKTTLTMAEASEGIDVTYTPNRQGTTSAYLRMECGDLDTKIPLTAFVADHEGTKEDPLTPKDVINLKNGAKGPYYVAGSIYKYTVKDGSAAGVNPVTDVTANQASNLILSQGAYKIGVALPSNSDVRAQLNVLDNPGNAGKYVTVQGSLEPYFSAPGVKSTTDDFVLTPTPEFATIADFMKGAVHDDQEFKLTGKATVSAVGKPQTILIDDVPNTTYVFLNDATGNMCVTVDGYLEDEEGNPTVAAGYEYEGLALIASEIVNFDATEEAIGNDPWVPTGIYCGSIAADDMSALTFTQGTVPQGEKLSGSPEITDMFKLVGFNDAMVGEGYLYGAANEQGDLAEYGQLRGFTLTCADGIAKQGNWYESFDIKEGYYTPGDGCTQHFSIQGIVFPGLYNGNDLLLTAATPLQNIDVVTIDAQLTNDKDAYLVTFGIADNGKSKYVYYRTTTNNGQLREGMVSGQTPGFTMGYVGNPVRIERPEGEGNQTVTVEAYAYERGYGNGAVASKTLSFDTTGIDGIEAENGATEYFNLQGLRVSEPVKGELYIVRKAGKTAKEIVK